jgi:hypothetical protein
MTKEEVKKIIESEIKNIYDDDLLNYYDDDNYFDYLEGFISGLVRVGAITNKEYSNYIEVLRGDKEL